MNFRELYKGDVNKFANRLTNKTAALNAERKSKRYDNFNSNRNIKVSLEDNAVSVKDSDRKTLLQKWRENKKKQQNIKNKRKPFVVGIKHHNVGSPLFQDISNIATTTQKLTPAKPLHFQIPDGNHQKFKFTVKPSAKKLTVPRSPNFASSMKKKQSTTKKEAAKSQGAPTNSRATRSRVKLLKENKSVNVPKPVVKKPVKKVVKPILNVVPIRKASSPLAQAESSVELKPMSEEWSSSSDSDNGMQNEFLTPSQENKRENHEFVISPFVTLSRGKQRRSDIGQPIDSAKKLRSTNKEYENLLNSEAAPFYLKLEKETENLIQKYELWSKASLIEIGLPKTVKDDIDSIVGQTRLLVKDKFEQFRSLIQRFECKVQPPVTTNDLDGFWEMMYLQVEKLNDQYCKLETMKENKWKSPAEIKHNKVNKPKRTVPAKKSLKPQGRGRFKNFLEGLKKGKVNSTEDKPESIETLVTVADATNSPKDNSGSPKTLRSESLLKRVLNSTLQERRRSSVKSAMFALNSSIVGKEMGTSPVQRMETSIDCGTPNKSILKKQTEEEDKSKLKKNVLFGEVTINDETDNEDTLNSTFTIEASPSAVNESRPELLTPVPDKVPLKKRRKNATPGPRFSRRIETPGPGFTPRRSERIISKMNETLQNDVSLLNSEPPRRSTRSILK